MDSYIGTHIAHAQLYYRFSAFGFGGRNVPLAFLPPLFQLLQLSTRSDLLSCEYTKIKIFIPHIFICSVYWKLKNQTTGGQMLKYEHYFDVTNIDSTSYWRKSKFIVSGSSINLNLPLLVINCICRQRIEGKKKL